MKWKKLRKKFKTRYSTGKWLHRKKLKTKAKGKLAEWSNAQHWKC